MLGSWVPPKAFKKDFQKVMDDVNKLNGAIEDALWDKKLDDIKGAIRDVLREEEFMCKRGDE
jgi:hypothetical protein